jgi:hypothetical protein
MATESSQLVVTIDIDGFQSEELHIDTLDDIDHKMQKFFEAFNITNPFSRMKLKSRVLTAFKSSQKRPSIGPASRPSNEERQQTITQIAQLKKIVSMTGSNFFKQNNGINAPPALQSKRNLKRSPEAKEGSLHVSPSQKKLVNKNLFVPMMTNRSNLERKRFDSKHSRSSKASYDLQSTTAKMIREQSECRLLDQRGCMTTTNTEVKRERKFDDTCKHSFFNFDETQSRTQNLNEPNKKTPLPTEIAKDINDQRTRLPSANVQSPDNKYKSNVGSSGSFQTKKNSSMKNPLWTYNINTSPNTSEVHVKYHIPPQFTDSSKPSQENQSLTRQKSHQKIQRPDSEIATIKEKELLSNPASERIIAVRNEKQQEDDRLKHLRHLFELLDEKQFGFICQKNLSFKRLSVDQLKYLEPIFLEVFTRDCHRQYEFSDFVQMCQKHC